MLAENAEIEANLERLREQVGEGERAVAALLEERAGMAAAVEELAQRPAHPAPSAQRSATISAAASK